MKPVKNSLSKNYLFLTALLVLSFFFFVKTSFIFAETRYYRSDTHTINGETGYQLKINNSSSYSTFFIVQEDEKGNKTCPYETTPAAYFRSDVYIKHIDGTETLLASDVAQTSRGDPPAAGYQSATWTSPSLQLDPTDAIKVVEKIIGEKERSASRTFITEPLGAYKLNPTVWTFTRYTDNYYQCSIYRHNYYEFWHGSPSYATRIEGIFYETFMDCGLRVFDSSKKIDFACVAIPHPTVTSPLRIRKGSTTYGVVLTSPTDVMASNVRIKTNSGIKALRRYYLAYGLHTKNECDYDGGGVVVESQDLFCQFTGFVCPAGWSQFEIGDSQYVCF